MRLTVPPTMGINLKMPNASVRQLVAPAATLDGEWARFRVPSRSGWRLLTRDGRAIYVFQKKPHESHIPTDGAVVLGDIADGITEADLSQSKWLVQPHFPE